MKVELRDLAHPEPFLVAQELPETPRVGDYIRWNREPAGTSGRGQVVRAEWDIIRGVVVLYMGP